MTNGKADSFYEVCEGLAPTIMFVLTKRGKKWGAYTDIPWAQTGEFVEGNGNTFVFTFDDNTNELLTFRLNGKKSEVFHANDQIFSLGKPHLSDAELSSRFKIEM